MPVLNCESCKQDLPLSEFKELDVGKFCQTCMAGKSIQKTQRELELKAKHAANELLSLESPDMVSELPRVKNILANIYSNFGGPDAFSTHVFWVIKQLSERRPMPVSVGALLLSLMKLHHTIEQTDEAIAAREMTEEQLKRETELATVKMVVESANDPEKLDALVKILGKQGYKLEKARPEELVETISEQVGTKATSEDFGNKLDEDIERELEELRKLEEEDEQPATDS